MKETGFVGLDGAGGKNNKAPKLRAVGAGSGVIKLDYLTGDVLEKVEMTSIVPGNQTVSRSEAYFVLDVLRIWGGAYKLAISIDATLPFKA